MADYSKSRAKKKEKKTIEYEEVLSKSEKNKITKKVKKSPVLLIALFCLVMKMLFPWQKTDRNLTAKT